MNKEKLLENGIVPQYLIAIVLLAVACLMVVLFLVMGKVNAALTAKSNDLRAQETRYDYLALQKNAEALRSTAQRLSFEKFDADTASLRLLNFSDYLNQRYKADMVEGIIKRDYDLQVRMRYSYTPTSVDDFIATIEDLTSREAPATYISTMTMRPGGGQGRAGSYFIEGELLISHPYYEEGGNR
jgi:hypothetical protein